jgi:RND family efflux transporter MFP subunit
VQQLQEVGSASDAEVLAAKQRLDTANAVLQAARQKSGSRYGPDDLKIAETKVAAEKASLEAERVSYANAHIVSPISGIVYLVPVARYDFVQMGTDLLHVADLEKLKVTANFYEPQINDLNPGEPVRVTWTGAPDRTWSGKIQSKPLAVSGDGVVRVARCIVELDDKAADLPVNTNVTLTATVEKRLHVLTLSRQAVRVEGPRHYVYKIVNGDLKKTPVEVGLFNASKIEITKGLRSGDRVAIRAPGQEKLIDKMRVKQQGQS